MTSLHNVNQFKNKKVLLIGDTIIDIYTYCTVVSEALYAPIPEAEETRSNISFGGNSLVANNILELGGKVAFVSVIGQDAAARHYDHFTHPNLTKFFFVDPTRKTTVKQRWFADGKAILQVNNVDNHDLNPSLEKKIFKVLEKEVKKSDIIAVMDPQHGFLTKNIIAKILELGEKYHKPVYVDVQISHRKSKHTQYKGADTFFLNSKEAKAVDSSFNSEESEKTLNRIAKKLNASNVIIKLGEKGSVALFGGKYIKTKAHRVNPVDVCGAGDAFLAAFSLCNREAPEDSLLIANIWGGLSTTIHGTVPPQKKDLKRALKKSN